MRAARMVGMLALLLHTACSSNPGTQEGNAKDMPRTIAQIIQDEGTAWLEIPGVEVVYESALPDGTPCIKVGISEIRPADRARLPEKLDGFTVLLVETGPLAPR